MAYLLDLPDIQTETIDGYRYYVCNDNKYPSITSVLSHKPKPHLEEWRNSIGIDAATKETNRCAERGSNVHEMCERFLNNTPIDMELYPKDHVKLFNKLRFALNKISNIYTQEAALYSDTLKVAGRVDCVAFYDNVLSVIDFKTSNKSKSLQMIEDYLLQETFYALALFEMTGIEVKQIVTIIGCESDMLPQIYIQPFKPHIKPLIERIDDFYGNNTSNTA
jgi:hypothetical protein